MTICQRDLPAHNSQSGALSLVGRVQILLSLVETFIELKYFHDVATPALLCHKEPARISDDHDLGPDLGERVLHSGYISIEHIGNLSQQGTFEMKKNILLKLSSIMALINFTMEYNSKAGTPLALGNVTIS